jgi:hypothetical protein
MKQLLFASLLAAGAIILLSAVELPTVHAAQEVKLTGCLVAGEDDDDGYLLTNAMGDLAAPRSDGSKVAPGPVGTTGGAATIFYWLEDDDDLETRVGQRVEIEGELSGDIEAGEIEIEREGSWTKLTIESDGRELTARVPQSVLIMTSGSNDERRLDVLVRKVDVEGVRMLAPSCQ